MNRVITSDCASNGNARSQDLKRKLARKLFYPENKM
jgi:hypothetical protein